MKNFVLVSAALMIVVASLLGLRYYWPLLRERVRFSPQDIDLQRVYRLAKKRASEWRRNAFLTDMTIVLENDKPQTMHAYFRSRGFWELFSDMARITVDIPEEKIYFHVSEGSYEPSYEGAFPVLDLKTRHSWQEVLRFTDSGPGKKYNQKTEVRKYLILTYGGNWIVRYDARDSYLLVNVSDGRILSAKVEEHFTY